MSNNLQIDKESHYYNNLKIDTWFDQGCTDGFNWTYAIFEAKLSNCLVVGRTGFATRSEALQAAKTWVDVFIVEFLKQESE